MHRALLIADTSSLLCDCCCVAADLSSVPRWLIPTAAEVAEAVASNSKVRLSANAEMAAAAARHKPMEANRRARAVPGQYAEQDPEGVCLRCHCRPACNDRRI